jgi:hypothetical protein
MPSTVATMFTPFEVRSSNRLTMPFASSTMPPTLFTRRLIVFAFGAASELVEHVLRSDPVAPKGRADHVVDRDLEIVRTQRAHRDIPALFS